MSSHVSTVTNVELPRDLGLLTRFYNDLMKPNFPIEEELEPLENWVSNLQKSEFPRRCYLSVVVATDPDSGKILGGIVFEYYHPSNCALITYLVISEATRGQGTAVFLGLRAYQSMKDIAKRHNHKESHVIFCEVNDPNKISDSEDAFSPIQRIRAFQMMGVRALDSFSYIQPSLSKDQEAARDMMLAVVIAPSTKKDDDGNPYVDAAVLKGFLADFYTELEVADHANTADWKEMMMSLKGRERVFLKDFDLTRFKDKKKVKKAALAPLLTVAPSGVRGPTIIVVGAGLSGLGAAQELQRAGFHVVVLEGRTRIGGRVNTGRTFDCRIDLGASWLHGLEGNPLYDYVQEAIPQLALFKNNEQSVTLFHEDGSAIAQDAVFEGFMKFIQLVEFIEGKFHDVEPVHPEPSEEEDLTKQSNDPTKNPLSKYHYKQLPSKVAECKASSTSLESALISVFGEIEQKRKAATDPASLAAYAPPPFSMHNATDKVLLSHFLSQTESLQSGSLHNLNAKDFNFGDEYLGGDNFVVEGFSNITVALSKGLAVHTGKVVSHVDTRGTQVTVKCTDSTSMQGAAVLMTLPIGVWHRAPPTFTPALPAWKSNAFRGIGAGLFNKVWLHFEHQFWPNDVEYFGFNFDIRPPSSSSSASSSSPLLPRSNSWFVNCRPFLKSPILLAMISGSLAVEFESKSDKEISAILMDRLTRMFGALPQNAGKALPLPVDVVSTKWGADTFSYCSYSFMKTGGSVCDFDNAALPVDGKIFFAGEHTNRHRYGYADGAYTSGLREAARIVDAFKGKLETTIGAKL